MPRPRVRLERKRKKAKVTSEQVIAWAYFIGRISLEVWSQMSAVLYLFV